MFLSNFLSIFKFSHNTIFSELIPFDSDPEVRVAIVGALSPSALPLRVRTEG